MTRAGNRRIDASPWAISPESTLPQISDASSSPCRNGRRPDASRTTDPNGRPDPILAILAEPAGMFCGFRLTSGICAAARASRSVALPLGRAAGRRECGSSVDRSAWPTGRRRRWEACGGAVKPMKRKRNCRRKGVASGGARNAYLKRNRNKRDGPPMRGRRVVGPGRCGGGRRVLGCVCTIGRLNRPGRPHSSSVQTSDSGRLCEAVSLVASERQRAWEACPPVVARGNEGWRPIALTTPMSRALLRPLRL